MATKEELKTLATEEIENAKPLNISVNGVIREMNDDEYEQKIIDLTNFKWEEQEYGYINARQEEYKPITDQLDQLYWAIDNGLFGDDAKTSQWYLDIKTVKTDNPKPS